MVYPYNGVLFTLKKESLTCYNIGACRHYTRWNKLTKKLMLYDPTYMSELRLTGIRMDRK